MSKKEIQKDYKIKIKLFNEYSKYYYDNNSPINYVNRLQGKYLLIHGSGDDNVHLQNSMRLINALIEKGKQFEWMIYPDKKHGIQGVNTQNHLYTKMTNFITDNL